MAKDEFTADDDRFLDEIEQAFLNDFPNPERVDCPGKRALQALARNRNSLGLRHPAKLHLGHCSPCYREFVQLKEQFRRRRRYLYTSAAGLLVAIAALWVIFYRSLRPGAKNPMAFYKTAVLDLENRTVLRGDSSQKGTIEKPLSLPRAPLDLMISLPIGSEDGDYEIQLQRQKDSSVAAFAAGAARLENKTEALRAKMDLRHIAPGGYILAIRRRGAGWNRYPVEITVR